MTIFIMDLGQFRERLDEALARAEQGVLIITRQGRPWIVAHSVTQDWDAESAALARSPKFWEMVTQRRGEEGIPWEEAMRELGLD
jgi:hypothetical protein